MERKKIKYFIGLDIGTNSVGWCLMDEHYRILKKGNKHLWGSRTFEAADSAQERRLNRSLRRRYNRRRERIRILREIMNDMVLTKDSSFFIKLSKTSFLDEEDKEKVLMENYKNNYNLFTDSQYTDKDYYKDFPTIYFLRKHLCESHVKEDPRLIYLALHHIVKYRGNFLYEDQNFSLENINIHDDLKQLMNQILEINHLDIIEDDDLISNIIEQFNSKYSRTKKVSNCLVLLKTNSKEKVIYKNILNGLVGLKFNVSKMFLDDTLKINDNGKIEDIELNFSDENCDEIIEKFMDYPEYIECVEKMKAIYSMVILGDILGSNSSISKAMIERYNNHKNDLKKLKEVIRENYDMKTYRKVFKEDMKGNYYSYIHHPSVTSKDDFYAFIKKILSGKENEKEIIEKINNEQFMPKQNERNNGNIPYQLNLYEMEKILENQSQFYPCLQERKDDILKILTFRIPYYYGPFTSQEFGWMIKKAGEENTRILPWNHENVVDIDQTAKKFINNLTNFCTYLLDEKVMPKKSLTCQMFEVLNELNKIRVNDQLLSIDTKNKIIEDLFMMKKKIREKDLIDFFKKNNTYLNNNNLIIKGYQKDKEFSTSLSSWIDFKKIFGEISNDNYQKIEDIIEDITIFKEKNILKRRLEKFHALDTDKINKILKLNYNGWSRLSNKLVNGIYCDNRFGSSATIIDVLKNSHMNLMEIINDKELGYLQEIDKYNRKYDTQKMTYEDVEHLACSPAVKRGIWQSLKVVEELTQYMKHNPSNIYIEFAREEGKKERTNSQIKRLQAIYKDLKMQTEHDKLVKKQLNSKDYQSAIDNDRLFLYFTQKGRCMYSGKKLDIDKLSLYQIDHIIPKSLTPDDSLDNKVLVISNENQRKLDDLTVPFVIRDKQNSFWHELYEAKLISEKKLYNLTRNEFSEKQIEKFINRQLVETRQIIKNVANILQNYYVGTKVSPIRAHLTHEFRKKYNIYKNRNVNDFHHAHDAYMTCVIGNYINHRFPNLEAKYVYGDYIRKPKKKNANSHEKSGFILNSMNYDYVDDETGEIIWQVDNIQAIKKYFNYKDCFVTKKLEEKDKEFFNATIYSPKDKKHKPAIAVNKSRDDITKYGGFSGLQYAMYAIEGKKSDKKKTIERKIVGIPLVYKSRDLAFKLSYLEREEKLNDIRIICEIKKNQLVEIDSGLYYITSPKELVNARQLILNTDQQKLISEINDAMSRQLYGDIDDEKINHLYDCLIEKIYKLYPKYRGIADKLTNLKDSFYKLSMDKKCNIINQILITLSAGPSNGNITYPNFKISNRIGRLSGQGIYLDKTVFIDTSITGIYSKRRKL